MPQAFFAYIVIIFILPSPDKVHNINISRKLVNIFLNILKHSLGVYISAVFVSCYLYFFTWYTGDSSFFPWDYVMQDHSLELVGMSIVTSILSIIIINKILEKLKYQ